jgi:ribosomal-protein-alanine N-acetyltransferase
VAEYRVCRVFAEIDTRNARSIRLVERLGFTRVALSPRADYFKGAYSDEYRYEWRACQADVVHPDVDRSSDTTT